MAFRSLFDQYRQRIYSFSMYLTRSEIISEEIVQDVFMKIWINRETLTEISVFSAYIRTAARNAALDYFRKMTREKMALHTLSQKARENSGANEDTILDREYGRILSEVIHALPPRQKEVYKLSREQGVKNEEIARQLGISIYTVKEHLKIAMRTVLHELEGRIELIVATAIALYL
jgi:RNA polymerase sigma-70 factor (family 1)